MSPQGDGRNGPEYETGGGTYWVKEIYDHNTIIEFSLNSVENKKQ